MAAILTTLTLACAFTVPIGYAGYTAACLQFSVVGACILKGRNRWIAAVCAGLLVLVLTVIWQSRRNSFADPFLAEVTSVPPEQTTRTLNWMIPEEDGVFLAAKVLSLLRGISSSEATDLFPHMLAAYHRFRSVHGDLPTPLIATTLFLQSSSRSDLVVFKARVPQKTKRALLFLHGFGGNWSLLCFLVSEAAPQYDTYCPSVGLGGFWSDAPGPELVERMVHELRSRGYEQLIFAGLSAGAVGAAEIAVKHRDWFDGLILLFGAHPDVENVALPTLYIYGAKDERFPPRWIQSFAASHAAKQADVTIVKLPVDHFALIKESDTVIPKISEWLTRPPGPRPESDNPNKPVAHDPLARRDT